MLLTTWTFAPLTTAVALVAGATYVLGVLRLRREGRRWPWWRTGIFLGLALPLVDLTVSWWPGARAHSLFAAYLTQVVVLALVAPALLVLGAPVRLGREALAGTPSGRRWDAVFDSRPMRVATHPLVTPLFMLALPVLVVFSPLLLTSLERPAVYAVVQLGLVVLGTLAVLGLVDGQVPEHGVPYAFAAFVAFFELLLDAVPGAVLFFTTSLLGGGWYSRARRPRRAGLGGVGRTRGRCHPVGGGGGDRRTVPPRHRHPLDARRRCGGAADGRDPRRAGRGAPAGRARGRRVGDPRGRLTTGPRGVPAASGETRSGPA